MTLWQYLAMTLWQYAMPGVVEWKMLKVQKNVASTDGCDRQFGGPSSS